ncbi:CAP domain-containing protein, partial [Candidatus Peregrinibacteria bacterium]|nr:CAP domain-containing protein [Candidatus Peregrinibacteria bacterium]
KKLLLKIYKKRVSILGAKVALKEKTKQRLAGYEICNSLKGSEKNSCKQALRKCFKKAKKNFGSCNTTLSEKFDKSSSVTSRKKTEDIVDDETKIESSNLQCAEGFQFENGKCVSKNESESCQWPSSLSSISNDAYKELRLNKGLPTVFRKGEIISVSGALFDKNEEYASAFLSKNGSVTDHYIAQTQNALFNIPFQFDNTGDYHLTTIEGQSGSNFSYEIEVTEPSCEKKFSVVSDSPSSLAINIQDNTPIFSWQSNLPLARITFIQGEKSVQHIVSNSQNTWKLDATDFLEFSSFKEGSLQWSVETADSENGYAFGQNSSWSKPKYKEFDITEHQFSQLREEKIIVENFPSKVKKGAVIEFSGKTLSDMNTTALVILPDGQVDEIELQSLSGKEQVHSLSGSKYLSSGSSFRFAYSTKKTGTHIIEINGTDGIALLNAPVYLNSVIPLVPDFFDLNPRTFKNASTLSLSSAKNQMLGHINTDRKNHDVSVVVLDDNLSSLAQARADDMVLNNYIAHFDAAGLGANDIRNTYGVKSFVSENIAQDVTARSAEEGLMRSAGHRKNIISPDWTRVGIGRAKRSDGTFIYVQNFSTDELSGNDIINLQSELVSELNKLRESSIAINTDLTSIAQQWSDSMAINDFFAFEDSSGNGLLNNVKSAGIQKTTAVNILANSQVSSLKESFLAISALRESAYTEIGVGVSQGNDGLVKLTVIYTK